jgi:signal transduction histidine kinase
VLTSFGLSFALTGVYAALLRRGQHIERLAEAQLVLDQITWTVIAYLTGGAASGATSFYGLSCLVGASLMGLRGATLAALSGAVAYGALVFSLQRGFLSSPPDQPPSIYHLSSDELTFYLLVNLLVLIVVALLAGTLADRLRWTGGALARATERADQAERMAGLGRLAAGLAHEIRNPLGSIAGSIQLLRTAVGSPADSLVLHAGERAVPLSIDPTAAPPLSLLPAGAHVDVVAERDADGDGPAHSQLIARDLTLLVPAHRSDAGVVATVRAPLSVALALATAQAQAHRLHLFVRPAGENGDG